MYGIVFTTVGEALLASLGTGESLIITRCMVGSGSIGSREAAKALTDLVQPVAAATSTKPIQKDNNVSLIVEYRNDLNGGLETGFDITEFGIWAQTGSQAEVMLLRGELSDHPHPIEAYTPGSGVETQRFPVSVGVRDDCPVTLAYPAQAFMTADDVTNHCISVVLPLFLAQAETILAHIKTLGEVLIPAEGWGQATQEDGEFPYYLEMPCSEVLVTHNAEVMVDDNSLRTAWDCGLSPTMETLDGYLRFRARRIPAEPILCHITLFREGGTGGTGGATGSGGYQLPIASETTLGGVMIGDNIDIDEDGRITPTGATLSEEQTATSQDIQGIISDVFGPDTE
ncbi:MAG TPA: hypothetical protein IAC25_02495 [Candidatus Enterenecus stercoripullorum]|nr:hypothetical protein [Candidatus Enterenecus stercoripullorum]